MPLTVALRLFLPRLHHCRASPDAAPTVLVRDSGVAGVILALQQPTKQWRITVANQQNMFEQFLTAMQAQGVTPEAGIASASARPTGNMPANAGGEAEKAEKAEKAEFIANIGMMAPSLSEGKNELVFNQLSAAFFTLTNAVRDTNGRLKNRKAALHAKLVAGLSKRLQPGESALYPIPNTPLVMEIRRTGGERPEVADDDLSSIDADFG